MSRIVFVSTPDVFGRVVPHANSILSMGILYVFFQTMALLFAFMVVAGSIMSTSAVQYVDECDVTSTGILSSDPSKPFPDALCHFFLLTFTRQVFSRVGIGV